jgi:hypothetical protein
MGNRGISNVGKKTRIYRNKGTKTKNSWSLQNSDAQSMHESAAEETMC